MPKRTIVAPILVAFLAGCGEAPAGTETNSTSTSTSTSTTSTSTSASTSSAGSTSAEAPTTDEAPTTSEATTGEKASGELLALTYNVAGLPEQLSGSQPALNMPHISPLLNDYELVLVQEDWLTPDPNPSELVVYHEVLAAEALHPYRSTPMPCPFGTDPLRPQAVLSDGLNRFSQSEFGELTRVRWDGCFGGFDTSDGGAADCLALKGFSVATHTFAPGVEVDVYNLHGEAGGTDKDQTLREADYVQLAAVIAERSPGRAIILGGDTNLHTDPGDPDKDIWDAFLAATGLEDVCARVDCGADATKIDKFAFRSGESVAIEPLSHRFERDKFVRPDDQAPLSDHPPLVVRFRWSEL